MRLGAATWMSKKRVLIKKTSAPRDAGASTLTYASGSLHLALAKPTLQVYMQLLTIQITHGETGAVGE